MFINELTIEVRDESLARVGQILPKDLVGFKCVMRFNNVGSWNISLPAGHPVGEILRQPGSGIIVTGPEGVLLSGYTSSATNSKTTDNPDGIWTISGVDDSVILGERLAYPTPSTDDVTMQTSAYDARPGAASTAIYGYVVDNIAENAPLARQVPGLVTATDTGIGSTVYPAARFDVLGELLAGIASVDGLGFDIKQNGLELEFSVFEPQDRSGEIRMDVQNNTLSKTEYAYGQHSVSHAIVGGAGAGTERQFIDVTSTDSLAAEDLWNRRIEQFVDKGSSSDSNELTQAGIEKLADGGMTLTSVDVVPSSDLTMTYAKDWNLGDRVTVVVGDQEVTSIVTTVSLSIEADGVRIGATVGDPTGVDYDALVAKKSTSTANRVSALERKDAAGAGVSSTVAIYALNKGSLYGSVIPAGTVVMFAGSQGDVINVVPAIANGTYPEHYLAGIAASDIPVDGFGNVIQLGIVDHINTSPFSLGDILYADPSTAGGLTLTPGAWKTPVAAVTRDHATTGRLLVRCIPGGGGGGASVETSDTAPTTPSDGQFWLDTTSGNLFIYYDDGTSSQWIQVIGNVTDARMTTAETNINLLDTRLDTAESNISSLQSEDVSLESRISALETANASNNLSGLVPIIPSSVTVSSGTATVTGNGRIRIDGATSFAMDGIFSSTYDHYRLIYSVYCPYTQTHLYRYRSGGVDNTGASYTFQENYSTGGTVAASGWSGYNYGRIGYSLAGKKQTLVADIFNPNVLTEATEIIAPQGSGQPHTWLVSTVYQANGSFDGMTLFMGAGTNGIYATVQIFGYRK